MDMTTTRQQPGTRDSARDEDVRLIDLRGIFATLRRRKWAALTTIALVLVATAIAYLTAPKLYQASATIALDRRTDELVTTRPGGSSSLTTDSPSVDTAVQVLTSPTLASEVADALGLAGMRGIGQPEEGPFIQEAAAQRRATNYVRRGLLVKRTGVSYAIAVQFSSPDRALTARVVNGIVDQYISGQRTGKEDERGRQARLLRDRIEQLRSELLRAETAVAQYRGATNLIDIDSNNTSAQQQISVLNGQLASAEAERAVAQARAAAGISATESPLLRDLLSQQAQLSAQRAGLASRYGPLHPDLARIDRQLADISSAVGTERGRIRASLAADLRVANERSGAIRSSLARAQGGLAAGNNASVQLAELERNAESTRGLYQALLDRYRQTVSAQGTDQSDAYVISRASAPGSPYSPSRGLFAAGGLIAALLAAGAVVAIAEMLENGLRSRREVEEQLGIPVIGTVPDLGSVPGGEASRHDPMGPADFLAANEASVFSEAFRSMRGALRIGQSGQSVRSLAVTSALPDEGKTTTAICLARSAALAGGRVVLIDCDARRRASSRQLAGQAAHGLFDVLADGMPVEQALQRDEVSGAYVLAQSGKRSNESDLMTSEAMRRLIADLSERFDLVVLDNAPVLPLAEARTIAEMADGVLLVTRWRKTPAQAAKLALDMLNRAGANVKGAALTRVDLSVQARSGLGDEMMYYQRFKSYYA